MVTSVKTAPINIPTGYESQQREIERRRQIAQALLAQGLQSRNDMISPVQAFGQIAQALVGKRMQSRADKREDEMNDQVRQAWDEKTTVFNNDAAMLSPQQMVAKWGSDPMMAERIKPYTAAMQTGMEQREHLIPFNGRVGVRQGDVAGQVDQGKPSDLVIRDQNGQAVINPLAVNAQAMTQGYAPPYSETGASAPRQAQTAKPNPADIDTAYLGSLTQALGVKGTADFLARGNVRVRVTTPQEAELLPSGTRILLPDGTEGKVP